MIYPNAVRGIKIMARLQWRRIVLAATALVMGTLTFGVGISMMLPICKLLFNDGETVHGLVTDAAYSLNHNGYVLAFAPKLAEWANWLAARVPEDPVKGVVILVAGLLVLSVFGAAMKYVHLITVEKAILSTLLYMRKKALDKMLRMRMERAMKTSFGDFITRVVVDTGMLQQGYSAVLGRTIESVARALIALTGAIAINWRLMVFLVAFAPPYFLMMKSVTKKMKKASRKESDTTGKFFGRIGEGMSNLPLLKLCQSEGVVSRRFWTVGKHLNGLYLKQRKLRFTSVTIGELMGLLGMCILLVWAADQIYNRGMSPASFIAAIGLLGAAAGSMKRVAGVNTQMAKAEVGAERIFGVLDEGEESMDLVRWRERKDLPKIHGIQREVALEGVSFRYPGAVEDAVRNVDLNLKKGEFVAIVGDNGCGKSTLAWLIAGLIRPTEGTVRVDGHSLHKMDLVSYWQHVGLVSQKTLLMAGTIRSNIELGNSQYSGVSFDEATRMATVQDFISELDEGYDREIFDGGGGLSGGQAQRVAIARELYKDSDLLILDEATSQVDPEAEARMAEMMAEIVKGRTTLVIAHRLSTVLNADRIIVMSQGKIVEEGTHQSLSSGEGYYGRIVQSLKGGM